MDLATCLKKMELVGVLAFATVDSDGAPQIRNISAIHYEPDALYFFTARGKNFCKELQRDGRVQILCYTKYKEMIRLSGKAYAVDEEQQIKWREKFSRNSRILQMCIREILVTLVLFSALTRERWSILISGSIRFSGTFILSDVLQ